MKQMDLLKKISGNRFQGCITTMLKRLTLLICFVTTKSVELTRILKKLQNIRIQDSSLNAYHLSHPD